MNDLLAKRAERERDKDGERKKEGPRKEGAGVSIRAALSIRRPLSSLSLPLSESRSGSAGLHSNGGLLHFSPRRK